MPVLHLLNVRGKARLMSSSVDALARAVKMPATDVKAWPTASNVQSSHARVLRMVVYTALLNVGQLSDNRLNDIHGLTCTSTYIER